MAYEIKGTTISLVRGDSFGVQIELKKDGEPYTPSEHDKIVFGMKHPEMTTRKTAYVDKRPLIEKNIPVETMILTLMPNDTKNLDFGEYVYDMEITYENGLVDTFVNNAVFKILPEVI